MVDQNLSCVYQYLQYYQVKQLSENNWEGDVIDGSEELLRNLLMLDLNHFFQSIFNRIRCIEMQFLDGLTEVNDVTSENICQFGQFDLID
jgi:hypothetical protein